MRQGPPKKGEVRTKLVTYSFNADEATRTHLAAIVATLTDLPEHRRRSEAIRLAICELGARISNTQEKP